MMVAHREACEENVQELKEAFKVELHVLDLYSLQQCGCTKSYVIA